jgi:hypothetical protein
MHTVLSGIDSYRPSIRRYLGCVLCFFKLECAASGKYVVRFEVFTVVTMKNAVF